MKKKKRPFAIVMFIIFIILLLTLGVCAGICLAYVKEVSLDESSLKREGSLTVLNSDGERINKSYEYISINRLPEQLLNAFIAVEDKRFYDHNGLDYKRIVGAALYDIKNKTLSQGASTITCQLVKNTQLNSEKTLERKLKEAKLAIELEKQHTKEEIIEMYLNAIYFGNGMYGIANASDYFFDKDPQELTLSQCASLAAIVANPKKFSPALNPQNNRTRRDMVLKLMLEQNLISEDDYNTSILETNALTPNKETISDSYTLQAIYEASKLLDINVNDLKASNYTIYTYNSKDEQQYLSSNVTNELIAKKKDGTLADYSVMIANPISGEIIAYISNHDYNTSTLKRNIGSTIKPFIYAKAMVDKKLLPASQLNDESTVFGDYTPSNYNDYYRGYISVRDALSYSSNVCAVKAMNIVGVDKTVDFLNSLNFNISNDDRNLSLALGGMSKGIGFNNLIAAYGIFANGGSLIDHAYVDRIVDGNGKTLYQRKENKGKVLDETTVSYINDCLLSTTSYGTAKKLNAFASLAAKTGTVESVNGNSDCWCVAYNGERTILSWQGNLSMKKDEMLTASGSCATLVVRHAIKNKEYDNVPITCRKIAIDKLSLERDHIIRIPSLNTPDRYIIYDFAEGIRERSPYFESPLSNFQAEVVNNSLELTLSALRECEYEIMLENITLEYDLQYAIIKEKEGEQSISFQLNRGIYLLSVTPIACGVNRKYGDTSTKLFYVY